MTTTEGTHTRRRDNGEHFVVEEGGEAMGGGLKKQQSVGELMSVTWSGLLGSSGSLRTWQVRIFLCIYIGYAACYVGKQSFNGLAEGILLDPSYGMDLASFGAVGSVAALGYTAGKVVSTLVLDSVGVRTLFPAVLLGIGLANVAFAMSTSGFASLFFWGINGVLQGLSWQPCARLLTVWYPVNERARWWGVVSTCGSLSTGVSQLAFRQLAMWLAGYGLGWRTAMLMGSLFPIFVSMLVTVWLRESPQDVGLDWEAQLPGGQNLSARREFLPMLTRLKIVLTSWEVQLLSVASFLVYIVRTAVNNWLALFLVQKRFTALAAGSAVFWFEIGGAAGSTMAGWMTDKIFGGRRTPCMICFSLGAVVMAGPLYWLSDPFAYSIAVFFFGFMVYGPQTFLGMMVAERADRRALQSAVGYNGLMSGFGAMVAGYPISLVVNYYGWAYCFGSFAACFGATVLLLIPLWSNNHEDPRKIQ